MNLSKIGFITGIAVLASVSAMPMYETIEADTVQTVVVNAKSYKAGKGDTFGPYTLKKGDVVKVDLTWNSKGQIYFGMGFTAGEFKGYYAAYDQSLQKQFIVPEDGEYYYYVGATKQNKSSVKKISGTISFGTIKKK